LSVPVLAAFLASRKVAKYKFPERVELRDQLPLTADGGKILRRALEEDIVRLLEVEGTR
jgi:non-ribosomal peptide synthetase component E (peptide arylation enzyme)